MENTDYEYWNSSLEGKSFDTGTGDTFMYSPQPGFYKKKKSRGGPWVPVAVWRQDGEIVASDPSGMIDAEKSWSFCIGNAITEEEYRHYEKHGRWQGECEVGHNNPPNDFEELSNQIQEAIAQAENWLKDREITTTQDADKAAGFQQKLAALSKQADKERTAEKKPHLDAGRAVDAAYKPLIDNPKGTIANLKAALTTFLRAEQKRKDEEARKAQIEAAKKIAEAEKIKADEEKKNLTAREEKIIREAETATIEQAPVKVSAGATTGRKVSLRKVTKGKITDYEKLLMALRDREEMKTLVQSLANRAAKAGVELDGMKIIEEQVV